MFVESIEAPVVADDDLHHLFRVLRLRDGESVTLSDGRGSWRAATVAGASLAMYSDVESTVDETPCEVAAAIPKGDRLEWMVQKLTEVGATRIILVDTLRSVVRWDSTRAARQVERLRRVVRDAASQSRRCWLPAIEGPVPVGEVFGVSGALLADPAGTPFAVASTVSVTGPVIVGPEGGFDRSELDAADRAGCSRVSLGDTVLRVETAAVVAAVLLRAGR